MFTGLTKFVPRFQKNGCEFGKKKKIKGKLKQKRNNKMKNKKKIMKGKKEN